VELDGALLEHDRRARAAALEVTRSFIVQAPAGSGKTELLIQRYLRLLATVEHPEEILAITFTRKAAQEMRLRVVDAVRDAERGVTTDEPHRRTTLEAAQEVLARDRRRGWLLLSSPRRMRIQTMDALNAGIARTLPLSSGLGGGGRIASDEELRLLYRAAAEATLDWLTQDGDEARAVETIFTHLDGHTGAYLEHIARMLASRDQWLAIVGSGLDSEHEHAVRASLERNIASQIRQRLERAGRVVPEPLRGELVELCRYAGANLYEGDGGNSLHAALAALTAWPAAEAEALDCWRAIAGLLLTSSGSWRSSVNRNNGFPPKDKGEKQRMLALLRRLAEDHPGLCSEWQRLRALPAPAYSDEQWTVLLALFRLLPVAVGELRRLFGERGVTDYTEVAIAADRALGHPEEPGDIAMLLDYSLQHILIDEMQDTSLAQYRLIEKLVAGWQPGDGRTLFCVGDPMQSIYRFRDAEVGQFLLAREAGIGPVTLDPLVLRRNFRSGERLVDWFNSVFERLLPPENDIAAGAIAYSASVPVPAHAGRGHCRIHPLFGTTVQEEADYGLEIIRDCLDDGAECSTAVLVRSRTQLPLLLSRLREAGIQYQAIEIDRLTDLPEIIDVLCLTRALCHLGDRIAWLGLLRGPWVGLDWTDLLALVYKDNGSTVRELLFDDTRLAALSPEGRARAHRFRESISPYLQGQGAGSLRDTVERAWYALRGPLLLRADEEATHVYRFLDVLERVEFAGTMRDVAQLEATLDQERVSGAAAGDCRLQVMTMHKAKGLQFDHVVLYGLGRAAASTPKSILSWLNLPGRGGSDMIISPVGALADVENDPLHQFIETCGRDKEQLELDRLLYVACTRARRSVHLIGHVALSADGESYREPKGDSLLQRLWPAVAEAYDDAFAAARAEGLGPPRAAEDPLRQPRLRRLADDARLPPGPELPGADVDFAPIDDAAERRVEYRWVGSVARHAGTILHRWLYRLSAGLSQAEPGDAAPMLLPSRAWAREIGVPSAQVEAVCERALSALAAVLEDARGRWLLYGPGEAELPVTGLWNGRAESIVIDRVRIDEEGTHWIVDYKGSTHEGGDLEGFLRQEAERYRPQLTKYAALYRHLPGVPPERVRTALYFPLLREFREITPEDI
jgi:ATP-dependent helicase/nuclease subunit A